MLSLTEAHIMAHESAQPASCRAVSAFDGLFLLSRYISQQLMQSLVYPQSPAQNFESIMSCSSKAVFATFSGDVMPREPALLPVSDL